MMRNVCVEPAGALTGPEGETEPQSPEPLVMV